MLKQALTGYGKVLGPEHPDTLRTVQRLGLVYDPGGNLDKAQATWDRALAGYQKISEPEHHPSTLKDIQYLGGIFYTRKEYHKAEIMLKKKALVGYQKSSWNPSYRIHAPLLKSLPRFTASGNWIFKKKKCLL